MDDSIKYEYKSYIHYSHRKNILIKYWISPPERSLREYSKKLVSLVYQKYFSNILYDLFCKILKGFAPIPKIPIVQIIFVTTHQTSYHVSNEYGNAKIEYNTNIFIIQI